MPDESPSNQSIFTRSERGVMIQISFACTSTALELKDWGKYCGNTVDTKFYSNVIIMLFYNGHSIKEEGYNV